MEARRHGQPGLELVSTFTLRDARPEDIPELMSIRNSVRENPLTTMILTAAHYERAMTSEGRMWVACVDDTIAGFVNARHVHGDIWALFVREAYERRGIARALMDVAESRMFSQGLGEIHLTTGPGTRAERLYRARGWKQRGVAADGDLQFALRPDDVPSARS